jgi:hypothetical protein
MKRRDINIDEAIEIAALGLFIVLALALSSVMLFWPQI